MCTHFIDEETKTLGRKWLAQDQRASVATDQAPEPKFLDLISIYDGFPLVSQQRNARTVSLKSYSLLEPCQYGEFERKFWRLKTFLHFGI